MMKKMKLLTVACAEYVQMLRLPCVHELTYTNEHEDPMSAKTKHGIYLEPVTRERAHWVGEQPDDSVCPYCYVRSSRHSILCLCPRSQKCI